MNIKTLLAIAMAFLPIAGPNAGKVKIAISVLQILMSGELNYGKIAELLEAGIPGAGEDAAKMTAIVQILKILGES